MSTSVLLWIYQSEIPFLDLRMLVTNSEPENSDYMRQRRVKIQPTTGFHSHQSQPLFSNYEASSMSHRIKAFVAPHTELGESPLYREEDNTLHYVDVLGRNINILQLGGEHKHERRTIQCPEPITFLSFHRDGGYLICSFSSIVRVTEDGKWTVLKRVFSDTTNMRFNDAGIDSTGRLWVGTIDRVLQ